MLQTELYIARRFMFGASGRKSTRRMVSVSVVGVALSLAVMIVAVAVTSGFKREIANKATGFAADIQVTHLDTGYSLYNMQPVSAQMTAIDSVKNLKGVRHVQRYCIKPGILKSSEEIQGIVLKGVGKDFDWSFFNRNMQEGQAFAVSDSVISSKIVLSRHLAKLLRLSVGDPVVVYFVQDPVRMRRFTVEGIYETGLMEFDKMFALVDMAHLQRLNGWTPDQISGWEIFVNKFDRLDAITDEVFDLVGGRVEADGSSLKVQNVRQLYSQLFDWLNLQDTTVFIVLLLMILVAGFNMISGLLIVILERTSTIGILKALGAGSRFIRRVFLCQSLFFIVRGLIWGNAIALTLLGLQWKFGLVGLDQESYFLDKVPVFLNPLHLIAINAGTVAAILLMLIVPSAVISRISPDTSIRFR